MELPGEKLILKLWETIAENGIGSLLRPWQLRREGRAQIDIRREELLVLAQAQRDADEIRSGRRLLLTGAGNSSVSVPLSPTTGHEESDIEAHEASKFLAQKASDNLVADALRREVNLSKAVIAAEADLADDPQEPSKATVEVDWLFRWRDCASAVSSEELQSLWGKALAGEIKSPGTFSLRTIEFLRNISQEEAAHIARLSRFVVADFIFRGDRELLDDEGLTFGFLLAMQQLGVVIGVDAIGLTITFRSTHRERYEQALVSNGRVLLVTEEDRNKEFQLPVYRLTAIGSQILRLGKFEPHEPYLRRVGQAIGKQGFQVRIARWQQVSERQGRYFEPEAVDG